jgi:hypothetical protein
MPLVNHAHSLQIVAPAMPDEASFTAALKKREKEEEEEEEEERQNEDKSEEKEKVSSNPSEQQSQNTNVKADGDELERRRTTDAASTPASIWCMGRQTREKEEK